MLLRRKVATRRERERKYFKRHLEHNPEQGIWNKLLLLKRLEMSVNLTIGKHIHSYLFWTGR